jgi:RNA polymerase sigma-70 factor (ECF subfamily)
MTSDEVLLLSFQRGMQSALSELFARYREPLHGFFYRRLTNRERAEDLTQDVFVAVIRGSTRYEPRASVRTYLYAIALKLLWAERRKQNQMLAPLYEEAPLPGGHPEASLAVRRAIELLDPNDREIILLREYEQLTYGEIADVLRLPLNTVRSRLFRSRMALKSYLEPATTRRGREEDETCN